MTDTPFRIEGLGEIWPPEQAGASVRRTGASFGETLEQALLSVNEAQRESETAQLAYARHEPVDLHDVLIKVEEAELAFKTMMEIRNKLVEAYREVMRMGG